MAAEPLFGPYGSAAIEYADRFAQYGANAVWFHGFDSKAFEACEKFKISACVEFKTFRAEFSAHPELIPIGVDGRPIRCGKLVQGVCLSNQEFLQTTKENLLAGIKACQPAGIWLDYLTYAGWFETPEPDLQESCFCPRCIAEFCEATGTDADTPPQILRTAADTWEQHKCERVAGFARHYANLIRSKLPDCIIGAYMCPWTPSEFNGALTRIFAQDYALLAPAVDIFTPLIYAQKSGRGPAWGREFLEASSEFTPEGRAVQLILDVLDFPDSLQALPESRISGWGLQLFGGASVFADPEQAEIFRRVVRQLEQRAADY
jgi:hypothetical protein